VRGEHTVHAVTCETSNGLTVEATKNGAGIGVGFYGEATHGSGIDARRLH
jgi:hypothetical protein